jgi:hypothetical protein
LRWVDPTPAPKVGKGLEKLPENSVERPRFIAARKPRKAIADTISGYHGDEDVDVDLQGSNVA